MRFSSRVLSLFNQDATSTLIQFALSILMARVLGPSRMGILIILLAILYYTDKLGRFCFEDSAVFLIQKGRYSFKDAARHLFRLALPQLAMSIAILFIFKEPILNTLFKGKTEIPEAIYVLTVLHVPVIFLININRKLLLTAGALESYNRSFWIIPLLQFLFLFSALFLSEGIPLEYVLAASLAGHMTALLLAQMGLNQFLASQPAAPPQKIPNELLTLGLKFYASTIPGFLQNRLDIMMLAYYLRPAEAAFYSLATTAAEILWKVPKVVQTLFFPVSAAMTDKDAAQFAINTIRRLTLILLPAALAGAFGIYPAVRLLYGERYLPVLAPFLLLLPGTLILGLGRVAVSYLQGRGHMRVTGKINLMALLINTGLNLILIPRYHTLGAAATSSFTYALTAFLLIRLLLKHARVPLQVLIPNRKDFAFYRECLEKLPLKKFRL